MCMSPSSDENFKISEGKVAGNITRLMQTVGGDKTHNILVPRQPVGSRKTKEKILSDEFKNFDKKTKEEGI